MAVSLSKGTNVSLTKEAPNVSAVTVGLGWDVRLTDGAAFDLDASAFVLGADDKVLSDAHFIFYNNKATPDGAVVYGGDNRTGDGAGDDRSEEHTSELQSLIRISYAVFCLKKKTQHNTTYPTHHHT